MANNYDSNITRKVMRTFLKRFEARKVLLNTVDTQLLDGVFTPASGTTVDFKRPHDYNTIRTAGGDISGSTKSDIIAGKATGTVQDFFTTAVEWGSVDEAFKLDQLEQVIDPMADRICTDSELALGEFMINNLGLSYGTPGTAVDAWGDVSGAGATMHALGVPPGDWYYALNPFANSDLANTQSGLSSGENRLVTTAWERAQLTDNVGGLRVLMGNCLKTRTATASGGDRVGAIHTANPDATYLTHKDTMIQTWNVDGFTGTPTIKAGEIVEVTGKYHLSLATRETFIDGSGSQVKFRGVVTEDVTLAAGAGALKVAGPAINEANGQYNTINAALADGDVITILGSDSAIYQPNLFYAKQAIGVGAIMQPKLYSTDTVAKSRDGLSMRVSKYADGDTNKQKLRIDLVLAFACFNPFFGGQGYGKA